MKTRIFSLLLVLVMAVGMLASCGGGTTPPPTPGPDNGGGSGTHTTCVDANHDLKCDVCKKPVACTQHKFDEYGICEYCEFFQCQNHKDRNHDLVCDSVGCDVAVPCTDHDDKDQNGKCDYCAITWSCPLAKHTDGNQDGFCDECKYLMDGNVFPWTPGNMLTFEMTENSNGQELPSGCKNWMAGEITGTTNLTAEKAIERNTRAYEATKVAIQYTYLPDNNSEYAWSHNYERIYKDQNEGVYSDMYCNFVYDMMGASLLGCFANLQTSRYDNYFEFAGDPNYGTEIGDANGYMYEYMTSLSIDENKMYLLASDYYIDLVRAFYCVPVNVQMLQGRAAEDILDLGRDNTVTDFADAVKNGKWTYDLLMKYTAKYGDVTVHSDQIGFAIAEHALSSSGLLYTTSVRLFTDARKLPGSTFIPDGENSPYSYAASNQKLYDFAEALETLVNAPGVVRFTKQDTTALGSNLLSIREKFVNNQVLFGGVILLGSLEYKDYQDMKTGGGEGFLIVPVPLYTDYNVDTNDIYSTQIHNVGRIGAISAITEKFDACSAFLNYQSTHSINVRNTYYEQDLLYSIVGGTTGDSSVEALEANQEMLTLLRDTVATSFDQAYEDMSALLSPNDLVDLPDGSRYNFINCKWRDIFDRSHYEMADTIEAYYNTLKPAKEKYMGLLFNDGYTRLPN